MVGELAGRNPWVYIGWPAGKPPWDRSLQRIQEASPILIPIHRLARAHAEPRGDSPGKELYMAAEWTTLSP